MHSLLFRYEILITKRDKTVSFHINNIHHYYPGETEGYDFSLVRPFVHPLVCPPT